MSQGRSTSLVEGRLLVEDLRLSVASLAALIDRAVAERDALDTFLLAAAASQILRDALEDDPAHLQRAASIIADPAGRGAARLVPAAASATSGVLNVLRRAGRARRELAPLVADLEGALSDLSLAVLDGAYDHDAARRATSVLDRASRDASLRGGVLRLPSCFRSFDQHPRDLVEMADRAARAGAGAERPTVVVGVRTSGSYLAPLLAAALARRLDREVTWVTLRPHRRAEPAVRRRLEELARCGAIAMVVDDPPSTGGSVHRIAADLGLLGFDHDRVWMALALLEGATLPRALDLYPSIVLEGADWDVHRRLAPESLRPLLAKALDTAVTGLRRVELDEGAASRGHAQVGFEAVTLEDGHEVARTVVAEGAGLGLFGRHGVALALALDGLVPRTLLFNDGIIVRDWLGEDLRVGLDDEPTVRAAVDYVAARKTALPAADDASASMAGQQPVWEVASRLLASPFGSAGLALRTAALDAGVRAVLEVRAPSVVDGQTGARSWFKGDPAGLRKVSYAERAFSNLDLACYDAAYDAAGVALGASDPAVGSTARPAYEAATNESISEECWLLYRLVHLWDRCRLAQLAPEPAEAEMARVWQDWARARLLGGGLPPGAAGRVCAIDIDGVLEVTRLGAPTITPSGAASLLGLRAHGLRPVLVTGRDLSSLQGRCERYGLDGGVAEYGCVAYDHRFGVVERLVDAEQLAKLDEAREVLGSLGGVTMSGAYDVAVRAYVADDQGSRRALSPDQVDEVLRRVPGVVAHGGIYQVDFVPAHVDKGTGLRHLLALLGDTDGRVELAVGDAAADLPMLRLARRAFVPAHARALAGAGVIATRRPYQRGLLDAVAALLGHRPGGCPDCAIPAMATPGAALIAAVLSGLEGGREHGIATLPSILASARRSAAANS